MNLIILDLNEQMGVMEERLKNALAENQRLRDLHGDRRNEIDALKVRLNEGDASSPYEQEDNRRRDLELKETINSYENQTGELKAHLARLSGLLDTKVSQNDRLSELLAERKRENDELHSLVCYIQLVDSNNYSWHSSKEGKETASTVETYKQCYN